MSGEPLAQVGAEVFFSGTEPVAGDALWKSDGTGPGTVLVKDIDPSGSTGPAELFPVPSVGEVYFMATTAGSGYEPWKSDGSSAGTLQVQEIAPGPISSLTAPDWAVARNLVFFVADDTNSGQELWAVPLGTPGAVPDGGAFFAGTPLAVDRAAGDQVTLNWGAAACGPSAVDYAVYGGPVGDFTAHTRRLCGTGGATTATFGPDSGDRYFIVVPLGISFEGSYGKRGDGLERPVAGDACLPRVVYESCP